MSLIVAGVVLYVSLLSIYISTPDGVELTYRVPVNAESTADIFTLPPLSILTSFL